MNVIIKITPNGQEVAVINGVVCANGDFISDHVRPLTMDEQTKYSTRLQGAAYIAGNYLMTQHEGEVANYSIIGQKAALLYLQAETYSNADNSAKAAAGREAMEHLFQGGSIKEAEHMLDLWQYREIPDAFDNQ